MLPYEKKLKGNARALRKKMTPEEKKLWFTFLKRFPLSVKRQYTIKNYIVDFYIPDRKTVIEIDGRQHLTPEHKEKDRLRDSDLSCLEINVLRYANKSINDNFSAVTNDILKHLGLKFEDLKPK